MSSGVYSIHLFLDGQPVFEVKFDRFSFDESRYVNSCINYPSKKSFSQTWIRCYRLPNNKFSAYQNKNSDGIIQLKDDQLHNLKIELTDAQGNRTEKIYWVKKDTGMINTAVSGNYTKTFTWQKSNQFVCEEVQFFIPEKALYNHVNFKYTVEEKIKSTISPVYFLDGENEPIHSYCKLKIQSPAVAPHLESKLLIVSIEKNEIFSEGGEYDNGFVSANIRAFGRYAIALDTVAPILEMRSFNPQQKGWIYFKVDDELSGINEYRVFVNQKWLVMEYDPKTKSMKGNLNDLQLNGKLSIRAEARDYKNNYSVIDQIIYYNP